MISVQDLSFHFGKFKALDRVSFSARSGEILGLLGPNGAGKTTLMRVLTTYLYPTQGSVQVGGADVVQDAKQVRRMIGYLPETAPLYMDMRVDEYLNFVAAARALSGPYRKERIEWVREKCSLKSVWKHAIFEISKGYKQRVGLAQALIHDPEVLILDEPTVGLDPIQILDIRNLIQSLSQEKTIIFSTHILQEIEALAERIVIMSEGRLIADGTQEAITERAMEVNRLRGVHDPPAREDVIKGLEESEDLESDTMDEAGEVDAVDAGDKETLSLEDAFILLLKKDQE